MLAAGFMLSLEIMKVTVMTKLSSLKSKLSAFTTDESGATLIEYGVVAALILVAAVAAIRTIGPKLSNTFSKVGAQL